MSIDRSPAEAHGPEGPVRHIGLLTTDDTLTITSWDPSLAAMTGIRVGDAVGRPLAAVVPDLEPRGLLATVRASLVTGAPTVLAPALHKYFIPVPPAVPSTRYDRMQQRVAIAALMENGRATGLVVTVEDVTERLELEHQLAGELREADPAVRLRAIERLRALSPVEGLGPLRSAIADEDWQVRRSAVAALAARRDPGLLDALISALREGHRNFNVLSSALQLLTMTGVDLTTSLVDLLRHPDADLRMQAALALGTQPRPDAVEALLQALDDEDVNVRFHAIEALSKLKPARALERLATIAESQDFFLAFPALDALSRINDPAVAPRILPLLADELVGDQAAEVLGQIGDEEVVAPLVRSLERPHASAASVAEALAGIHRRYAEMFSGGAAHIEELVRASISAGGAQRLIDGAGRASGSSLRAFVVVLGWLRGSDVERALTLMLGRPGVQAELLEAIVRFGAPMVDRLVEQADSEEPEARRAAVVALGRIGDSRGVEPLVRLLEEGDPDLLPSVAAALGRLGDRAAFEPLIRRLGDPDVGIRQAVIGALNSIGHPEMGGRIGALMADSDPHVRESAVKIAGYFGYPSCADGLLDRCLDTDETVRAAALEHVAFLDDPRAVPLLVAALVTDTPRARAAAGQGLAHIETPEAVAALRSGASDPDPWVRYFCVTGLGRRGDRASLPVLEQMAAADPAPAVRIAAVGAIGAIGIGTEAAAPLLATFTDAADSDLAVAALRALGSVGGAAALDPLRRALAAAQPELRTAAAEALARRGGADAVELLQWTAAADPDPSVMRAAIAGLSRIAVSAVQEAPGAVAAIAALSTDADRRADAIAALAGISESAIQRVADSLSSREPSVRRAVVEALGRRAHPTASGYVATALVDGDASVRQLAVTVLSRLGTRGVARSFADMAANDPSEGVRHAAEIALRRIGKAWPDGADPLDPQ